MKLQENIRRILREEETPKYDDGGSSVYEKEKPYQVYSPITQNVEGYFENKKEAEQFAEKFEDSIVYDIREEEKVGKEFWFEYHCFESDESCDAEIWYRSHQKVKVVDVAHWSLDDKEFRYEDGQFRVYIVEWKDGFRYDVFEDELMESPDEFYRPDPPKRKIQEQIKRVLREEVNNETFNPHNENYLDAWLGVGDEDMDSYEEYGIDTIRGIIDEVKKLKFPLRIYRGINTLDKQGKHNLVDDLKYDNVSWSTSRYVSEEFGNVIYTGIVDTMDDIDLEYTIYRRVLHKPLYENEIVMKDNRLIKNLKRFK